MEQYYFSWDLPYLHILIGLDISANVLQERFAGSQSIEKQSYENKDRTCRQTYGGNRQTECVERWQKYETGISVGLLNLLSNLVSDYEEPL